MTRRVCRHLLRTLHRGVRRLPSVSPHRRWRTRRPKTFGVAVIATGWFCVEASGRAQTVKKKCFSTIPLFPVPTR